MGLVHAVRYEKSFRFHLLAMAVAILVTVVLRPGWVWGALIAVGISLVLLAELVNTAVEHTLDGLHPDQAEFVAVAKDCAAGAVLVASILALVVFGCMVLSLGLL